MDLHTVGSLCVMPFTHGRIIAYRLKVPVGSAGVCSKTIGVKDTLQVVLVASQVVTSHKISGSWEDKAGGQSRQLGAGCDRIYASFFFSIIDPETVVRGVM